MFGLAETIEPRHGGARRVQGRANLVLEPHKGFGLGRGQQKSVGEEASLKLRGQCLFGTLLNAQLQASLGLGRPKPIARRWAWFATWIAAARTVLDDMETQRLEKLMRLRFAHPTVQPRILVRIQCGFF